jgi:HEPN domain-containing protein
MAFGMKRSDLRAMAQAKLDDATILLYHGRFSNAYYLAGYAVELAIKACIAAQISAETIPDKDFIRKMYSHVFPELIGLAGLAAEFKRQKDANPAFAANWAIVSEWSPDARYEVHDPMSAQLIVQAITDTESGVLRWIKAFW